MFPQSIIGREFATNDSKTVNNSQYAWFRVRNKNERRTLRATFNFVRSASPEDYSSSSLSYTGLETPLTVNADKCSKSRNFKYSLGLSGTFEFSKGHFMDVSASATASRNHYSYDYVENDSPVNSDTGEDYYNISANVLYGMKFERGNSLVFKVSEFHNVSSANYFGGQQLLATSMVFRNHMLRTILASALGKSFRTGGSGLLRTVLPPARREAYKFHRAASADCLRHAACAQSGLAAAISVWQLIPAAKHDDRRCAAGRPHTAAPGKSRPETYPYSSSLSCLRARYR